MANVEGGNSGNRKSTLDKAKKAREKAKKAKKALNFLKSIKALAPLVSILGTLGIVLLVIFLIIGYVGLFLTLPGLAVDKFLEACSNFWKWLAMDDSITVQDYQIDDLGSYIEDMGYNLEAYGFVSPGMVERTKNDENSTGNNTIHIDNENSKIKNLYAYVLANERTYTIQHSGGGGFFVNITNGIIGVRDVVRFIDQNLRNSYVSNFSSNAFFGLIRIPNDSGFDVKIDRDKNEMLITTNTGLFGYIKDQMKWDLSGWTARYGKPIELSLALHLSTMAPDFVYDFSMDNDLQTVVNIETHQVEYDVDYCYRNAGKTITKKNIEDIYNELVDIIPTYDDLEHLYTNTVVHQFVGRADENETFLFSDVQGQIAPVPIDVLYKTNLIKIWIKDQSLNNSDVMICKMVDEKGRPICFKDLNCNFYSCFKTEFKNDVPYFKYVGSKDELEENQYDFTLENLLYAFPDTNAMSNGGTNGGYIANDNFTRNDLLASKNKEKYMCLYSLSLTDVAYLSQFFEKVMNYGLLCSSVDGTRDTGYNMCAYAYRCIYEKAIDSLQKAINEKIIADDGINTKIQKYRTDCNLQQYEVSNNYKLNETNTWNLKDNKTTINIRSVWNKIIFDLRNLKDLANAENKNEPNDDDDKKRFDFDVILRNYPSPGGLLGSYLEWDGDEFSTFDDEVKDENGNLKRVTYCFSNNSFNPNVSPLPPKFKKEFNQKVALISLLDCPGDSNSFIDWVYHIIRETSGDNVIIESEQGNSDYSGYYESIKDEKGINIVKIVAALIGDIEQKLRDEYEIDAITFFDLYDVFKKLAVKITSNDPYITSVTHHWYKDLYFKDDARKVNVYNLVDDTQSVTKKFVPEGDANNDIINELTDSNHYFEYTMTNRGSYIKQTGQPQIVKTESWHYMVKNWIKYGYYFIYDGTNERAERIEYAREILGDRYKVSNPLLIDIRSQEALFNNSTIAEQIDEKAKELNSILRYYDTRNVYDATLDKVIDKGVKGVRLQKIDFEKKSSLTAFSILEGMHTKDSEYIYRDLKEFLIELGYFTRADFEEIETDVFEWIIPSYQVYKDEWPDSKYEKSNTQYGTYIRNSKLLNDERKKEAEENAKKMAERGQIVDNTDSSNIMGTTEDRLDISYGYRTTTKIGTVTYKNYKQYSIAFTNETFQGLAWGGQACGPTSTAILTSGYGSKAKTPVEIGKWVETNTNAANHQDGSGNEDLGKVLREYVGINCENDYLGRMSASEKAQKIEDMIEALQDTPPRPVLTTGSYTSGGHWICILGIDSNGKVKISDPGNVATVSNYLDCSINKLREMLNTYANGYVIALDKPTGGSATDRVVVGFNSGLEINSPQKGIIKEIEDIEQPDDEQKQGVDYYAVEGKSILIEFKKTGTGVDGWKMKIEGIDISPTVMLNQTIEKGQQIGFTNNKNIKIILYDDKDAIINNVEDYFKLKTRKKNTGTQLPAGELEELSVMILEIEGGMNSNSDGDYWIAMPGNGTFSDITAGGSGVTNYCEQEFYDTGHADLYPMHVGDRLPKSAILEVKAKAIENHYDYVSSCVERYGGSMTESQKQAIASAAYNLGDDFVDDFVKTYLSGDTDRAKWEFLNLCHAGNKELWGLKYRRAIEWDIFENGGNYEYTEQRRNECYEKYYTNFYYKRSY